MMQYIGNQPHRATILGPGGRATGCFSKKRSDLSERFVQVLSDRLKASITKCANLIGAEDIHTVNVSLEIKTVHTSQCENTQVVRTQRTTILR
jgi:hypothetical protein